PNSADSSARVFSPESDAIATRALNSALCCFLFTPTSHVLWTGQPLAYTAVQNSRAAAANPFIMRGHVIERIPVLGEAVRIGLWKGSLTAPIRCCTRGNRGIELKICVLASNTKY